MSVVTVSVIVPCFNVEEYVSEALDSVLRQDLSNIEIICIDDCSTDSTYEVLQAVSRNDSRVSVLRQPENKGQGCARNAGLAVARGKYVFFFDSDDLIPVPDALSRLYAVAEEDGVDMVLGRTLRWQTDTDEKVHGYHKAYQQQEARRTDILQNPEFALNMITCNKLIRLDMIQRDNLCYDERLTRYEDLDLSCRLLVSAKSISYIPYTTYIHRRHSESTTNNPVLADTFYYLQAALNVVHFLSAHEEYFSVFEKRVYHYIDRAFRIFLDTGSREDIPRLMHMLQDIIEVIPRSCLPGYVQDASTFIMDGRFMLAYQKISDAAERTKIERLQAALDKLRDSNQKLRGTNQKLRESRNLAKETNQKLRIVIQKLRDSGHRLKEQLTASNARLRKERESRLSARFAAFWRKRSK